MKRFEFFRRDIPRLQLFSRNTLTLFMPKLNTPNLTLF